MSTKTNWALVTGASSGIGAAISVELAKKGHDFILVGRDFAGLEKTSSLIREQNPTSLVKLKIVNLSDELALEAFLRELQAEGLVPHVLVNNAGFGVNGHEVETEWKNEKEMVELNIVALSHLTKVIARRMIDEGIKGSILQLASIGAYFPMPKLAAYAATKAYVLHYSLALRQELKPHGINVSVLSPGATATKFFDRSGQKKLSSSQARLMMTGEAVAKIAIRGLAKGKAEIIPGVMNRFFAIGTKFMSRSQAAKIAESQI